MSALKPTVFVVSAPSGAGKTTLNARLARELSDVVEVCVSLTSRTIRTNEVHGLSYWFVSKQEFEKEIEKGAMLEYADVFGQLYGTRKADVECILNARKHAILEIDVQGWKSVRDKFDNIRSIFILPPSMESIWNRLEKRGTDSLESRKRRLIAAKDEIAEAFNFDEFIVNENINDAFDELKRIIIGGGGSVVKKDEALILCQKLLGEFDSEIGKAYLDSKP